MIVVAMAAIGIWSSCIYTDVAFKWFALQHHSYLLVWIRVVTQWLLAFNLAILLLRSLPPRPSPRRLARQPGFLAGVAVLVTLIVQLIEAMIRTLMARLIPNPFESPFTFSPWRYAFLGVISDSSHYGPAVILAWVIGLLQGFRWGRSDWIERWGRWLGGLWVLGWIALMFLDRWLWM